MSYRTRSRGIECSGARGVGASLDLDLPRRDRRGMAHHRTTSLVDDLTGSAATETVRFGFGGPEFEIDLSAEHAETLRSTFAPYIARARRVRRVHVLPARRPVLRIGVTVDPEWTGSPTQ